MGLFWSSVSPTQQSILNLSSPSSGQGQVRAPRREPAPSVGPSVWGPRCGALGVGPSVWPPVWGPRCGALGVGPSVWGPRCGALGGAPSVGPSVWGPQCGALVGPPVWGPQVWSPVWGATPGVKRLRLEECGVGSGEPGPQPAEALLPSETPSPDQEQVSRSTSRAGGGLQLVSGCLD